MPNSAQTVFVVPKNHQGMEQNTYWTRAAGTEGAEEDKVQGENS